MNATQLQAYNATKHAALIAATVRPALIAAHAALPDCSPEKEVFVGAILTCNHVIAAHQNNIALLLHNDSAVQA